MALEAALETYRQNLALLLKEEGKFVLIFERNIAGLFDTYEDALSAGYEKFGVKPFLVKRIEAVEQVQCVPISWLRPCPI